MTTTLLRHDPLLVSFKSTGCKDLYAERVLIPRVLGFAAVALLSMGVVVWCLRRRSSRASTPPIYSPVPLKSDDLVSSEKDTLSDKLHQQGTVHNTRIRRWVSLLLGIILGWAAVFLLSFQSYERGGATSLGLTFVRPRVVFSFTTIAEGITKLEPTLDALVNQDGVGFDAIYVIVPREYRKMPVVIPSWLVADVKALNRSDFHGIAFATGPSTYHAKVHIILLNTDFGPASKVLGTLLVEQDPETLIVYGDDDRVYPPQLSDRALHYANKFPNEAVAVLGGWIAAEDSLYCGRSLELGANRVSFVGGAGGVAVRRRFFGLGATALPAFKIASLSKACFLGDDYYLSHLLSINGVARRLVYDSCWNLEATHESYPHGGLSFAQSTHPGGANVEHYQQCIRELGLDKDLSGDGEFGWAFMVLFAHTWGAIRGLGSWIGGHGFVAC